MKKSLLIILSLIFMSMSAHAVGVDCWEEVSNTFEPDTVSKMQAVLGNNVTITRVKTVMKIVASSPSNYATAAGGTNSHYIYSYPELREIEIPLMNYLTATGSDKAMWYLRTVNSPANADSKNSASEVNGVIFTLYNSPYLKLASSFVRYRSSDGYTQSITPTINGYSTSDAGGGYIHTYCIENTNSGGGGGGAAGASVNYIIKAN